MRILVALTLLASMAQAQKPNVRQIFDQAAAAQRAGDVDAAVADYRKILRASPDNAEAHTDLGASLAEQGDYPRAIEELKLALPSADQKQRPGIELALGMAYYQVGDLESARPNFLAVLETSSRKALPAQVKAATLLASCDLKRDDPDAALVVLAPHRDMADRDADLGMVLGLALVRTGKLHDGAQALRHAAELTGDAGAYLMAGSASLENAEVDEARRDLELAHKINPGLAGLDVTLSIARFASGDALAAEVSLHQAIRSQPEDFLANLYLGVMLLVRGDLRDAANYLERSLTLHPAVPPVLAEASIVPALASQLDPAIQALSRLAAREPKLGEPQRQLDALYQRLAQAKDRGAQAKLALRGQ